jgi:hypothetical protein
MQLTTFLNKLNTEAESITFADTMTVIEATYKFTPTAFRNGDTENAADTNNGSCKIFAFGLLNNLTEPQTLACFGQKKKIRKKKSQEKQIKKIENKKKKRWGKKK